MEREKGIHGPSPSLLPMTPVTIHTNSGYREETPNAFTCYNMALAMFSIWVTSNSYLEAANTPCVGRESWQILVGASVPG